MMTATPTQVAQVAGIVAVYVVAICVALAIIVIVLDMVDAHLWHKAHGDVDAAQDQALDMVATPRSEDLHAELDRLEGKGPR